MSGASIRIEVFDAALQQRLRMLEARLADIEAVYASIAEILLNSTRERFLSQSGPDGAPWADLSPAYLASQKKRRSRFPTAIGRLNGYLMGLLVAQSSSLGAEVGSNRVYAAMFQFGGAAIGRNQPARPFLGISDQDRLAILGTLDSYLMGN